MDTEQNRMKQGHEPEFETVIHIFLKLNNKVSIINKPFQSKLKIEQTLSLKKMKEEAKNRIQWQKNSANKSK